MVGAGRTYTMVATIPNTDTIRRGMRRIVVCILVAFIAFSATCSSRDVKRSAQEEQYFTDLSNFLAGIPVPQQSRFWEATQHKFYAEHIKFMNNFWDRVMNDTVNRMVPWREAHMVRGFEKYPAFYPLSGADFINFYTIIPDAPEYVMVAMEHAGPAPEPLKLNPQQLRSGLAALERVVFTYGYFNYFASRTMQKEMSNISITGATPVIMIFMARLGLRVTFVEPVGINNDGALEVVDGAGAFANGVKPEYRGIRIEFRAPKDTKTRQLVYISMKMMNDNVQPTTPSGRFFARYQNTRTMMKSAVYLCHYDKYKGVKEFILGKSIMLIQDDSGIPFRYFNNAQWDIKLFGVYKPYFKLEGCHVYQQPELFESYKNNSSFPLPFHFGYGSVMGRERSTLILAVRKQDKRA